MRLRFITMAMCAAALFGQQKLTPVDETSYKNVVRGGAGKVTLVDFWATWCAPCRKEMPQIGKLEAQLRDKGFRLVTISADEPEAERAAVEFLKTSGISSTAYIRNAKDDDAFIRAVDPKWAGTLPAMFLYDRQGKLVKSFTGETDIKTIDA